MKQLNSDILWAIGYHSEDEIQHPMTDNIFKYLLQKSMKRLNHEGNGSQ